jgi:hypothetical protein
MCINQDLVKYFGYQHLTKNNNFFAKLLQMNKEIKSVKEWIKDFTNQQSSDLKQDKRDHPLAVLCNLENDLAQLVQKELLSALHTSNSVPSQQEDPNQKIQHQLSAIEKNVTKAINKSQIVKSFLQKATGQNSEVLLEDYLFPKTNIEKSDNVKHYTKRYCNKCFFKFNKEDPRFKQATPSRSVSKKDDFSKG